MTTKPRIRATLKAARKRWAAGGALLRNDVMDMCSPPRSASTAPRTASQRNISAESSSDQTSGRPNP